MLPIELGQAIEALASGIDPRDLARAAGELSDAYRAPGARGGEAIRTQAHRAAYIVTRLPATFEAARAAIAAARETLPNFAPRSALDLGAGPGTASWAAVETFRSLESLALAERDARMIEIGQGLAVQSGCRALERAVWMRAPIDASHEWQPSDLVMLSYALGEIPADRRAAALEAAWRAAAGALVIVEPGTPAGFAVVRAARAALIAQGARVAAPCPHDAECPMAGTEPWCHFARRVARSRRHRLAKGGELGWEDEKFSYCVLTRRNPARMAARIIAPPAVAKGWVRMKVCGAREIEELQVARRDAAQYKRAKKSEWGDGWEEA